MIQPAPLPRQKPGATLLTTMLLGLVAVGLLCTSHAHGGEDAAVAAIGPGAGESGRRSHSALQLNDGERDGIGNAHPWSRYIPTEHRREIPQGKSGLSQEQSPIPRPADTRIAATAGSPTPTAERIGRGLAALALIGLLLFGGRMGTDREDEPGS